MALPQGICPSQKTELVFQWPSQEKWSKLKAQSPSEVRSLKIDLFLEQAKIPKDSSECVRIRPALLQNYSWDSKILLVHRILSLEISFR